MKINCIITCAGKGSRFDNKKNKILHKVNNKTLIENIFLKIKDYSNKVIIVCNYKNIRGIQKIIKKYNKKYNIIYKIQKKQDGMASAINVGLKNIGSENFFIIWGDQFYIKKNTIKKSIKLHLKNKNLITLPYYNVKNPYTFIIRDRNKNLKDILQKREVNFYHKFGDSDCGFFVCKTKLIKDNLPKFIFQKKIITKKTKEHDFLKSLKFFSKIGNIHLIRASSAIETKGINFKKDIGLK